MAAPLPLILDVDTGIDDSLALLYAAGSPEADLVAVTCVSGNIDARQVGVNTRAILRSLRDSARASTCSRLVMVTKRVAGRRECGGGPICFADPEVAVAHAFPGGGDVRGPEGL